MGNIKFKPPAKRPIKPVTIVYGYRRPDGSVVVDSSADAPYPPGFVFKIIAFDLDKLLAAIVEE